MEEIQPYSADCYVFYPIRSYEEIYRFLDNYVPNRSMMQDDFCFPQHGKEILREFQNEHELIKFLCEDFEADYMLYWRNERNEDIENATCTFTEDHNLILGLSCATKYPNVEIESRILKSLKSYCETDYGLIVYESPPPRNSVEFRELCKKKKYSA